MNVRESIETIGVKRLSELAGVTMATVDRTKIRGAFSSRPAGARIRQAIRDEGLRLDGDDVGGEQPDLPMEDALSTRLRKEDLAWKSERARGVRMKNDEAEGLLLPAHEVSARVSQAGVAFQRAWRSKGRRRRLGVRLRRCAATNAAVQLLPNTKRRRTRPSPRCAGHWMENELPNHEARRANFIFLTYL